MMNRLMNRCLIVGLCLSLMACKSWWANREEDTNPYKDWSEQRLYDEAKHALAKNQYSSAIKRFEAMESMYPFSNYTERAQLDLIYAYYKNDDFASAAATAEHFIRLYPRAEHVDYAYYMKGMANFKQPRGVLANVIPINESWRDPGTETQAYSDFASLIQKFPNSRYKADSLQRMIYLRNMFAKRELNTANYYFERKMYVAAAGRASGLIKDYPQAPSVQQALVILHQANQALGLQQAEHDAKVVYQATYPNQALSSGIVESD